MAIGKFILPTGGGTTPEVYYGQWKHHWGIDILPYATSGKIAMLVRGDVLTCFRSQGGAGFTVRINDSTDVVVAAVTDWVFNPASYTPIKTDIGNGYAVHLLVFTFDVSTTIFDFRTPTGYPSTYSNGCLWLINNTTTVRITTGVNNYCECWEQLQTNTVTPSFDSTSQFTNIQRINVPTSLCSLNVYNKYLIKELVIPNMDYSRVSYQYMLGYCQRLEKADFLSGTYPNATIMANMIEGCTTLKGNFVIDAPNLTNFANNGNARAMLGLSFTRSNFRNGSATPFSIAGACSMTVAARTALLTSIYNYEILTMGGSFAGKTFNISGGIDPTSTDPAYVAIINAMKAAGATLII